MNARIIRHGAEKRIVSLTPALSAREGSERRLTADQPTALKV